MLRQFTNPEQHKILLPVIGNSMYTSSTCLNPCENANPPDGVEGANKVDWEGVPGTYVDDRTAPDGRRFVASKYGYVQIRRRLWLAVGKRCEECTRGTIFESGQLHHVYGRGIGGGKREDRREVAGVIFTRWLCAKCHGLAVILRWGSWVAKIDYQGKKGRGKNG
jgi:hypothetical protein